ncbi:MAG: hypothetical protein Ct9H90mP11_02870 [Acidimicrobiales bacterium]|nr:MAG: hypothetical protein Ct9H90mP11_02870 [Acidimicrobiales bacterium]
MAAELAAARERLSQTPAAEVIANHVMGIYELALFTSAAMFLTN